MEIDQPLTVIAENIESLKGLLMLKEAKGLHILAL
jgi:hypothetical protein